RMRNRIIVQPGDVPELNIQVGARFAVRTVEGSILGRVLIGQQCHMECGFDGRNGAFDLNFHAIARSADHREAVRERVLHYRVVVALRWAELFGEFSGREEVAEVGNGRAVQFREKRVETGLVADGQNNIQLQDLSSRKMANQTRLAGEGCLSY